jgi:hypothetical protein
MRSCVDLARRFAHSFVDVCAFARGSRSGRGRFGIFFSFTYLKTFLVENLQKK